MDKSLENLEVYQLALSLSNLSRKIYDKFDFNTKKVIWNQYITSIDSVGANIAEGYGRFHYLDSTKFYYNARWSLNEAKHWLNLLHERGFASYEMYNQLLSLINLLAPKLNNFINSIKQKV